MQPDDYIPKIPDKHYFKIGEVSILAGVPAYVLRFWEKEFTKIRPKRTDSGQRLYRKKDVELILKIKYFLYKKKLTIEGARQHLKLMDKEHSTIFLLHEIRSELIQIRNLLSMPSKKPKVLDKK